MHPRECLNLLRIRTARVVSMSNCDASAGNAKSVCCDMRCEPPVMPCPCIVVLAGLAFLAQLSCFSLPSAREARALEVGRAVAALRTRRALRCTARCAKVPRARAIRRGPLHTCRCVLRQSACASSPGSCVSAEYLIGAYAKPSAYAFSFVAL
eukprot:3583298-Pleurochrysis_carterae.AAC.1